MDIQRELEEIESLMGVLARKIAHVKKMQARSVKPRPKLPRKKNGIVDEDRMAEVFAGRDSRKKFSPFPLRSV